MSTDRLSNGGGNWVCSHRLTERNNGLGLNDRAEESEPQEATGKRPEADDLLVERTRLTSNGAPQRK